MLQDSMEMESDDDDYADAVQYDDIIDDDMRITNSCKPLSMYSYTSPILAICTATVKMLLNRAGRAMSGILTKHTQLLIRVLHISLMGRTGPGLNVSRPKRAGPN